MKSNNEPHTTKTFATTLTQRGQITLPAEIHRALGVRPRKKVTFTMDGDEIRLVAQKHTLESVHGLLPKLKELRTLVEIVEIAPDEHARHVLDEMK